MRADNLGNIRTVDKTAPVCEWFDFHAFSRDVFLYAKEHADVENDRRYSHLQGGGGKRSYAGYISYVTGLTGDTVRFALRGYVSSFRTVCVLADWADLSLDKYRKREFG